MLTYKKTNAFFISLLIIFIGVDILYGIPFFVFPLLVIIYALIIFYGCYFISSGFFIDVICSAKTKVKEIAISFDDGPVEGKTQQILQTLKINNVQAAFFCIGNRIAANTDLLKQLDAEGHLVGNHSNTHHFLFDLFSSKKMMDDLRMMDDNCESAIGYRPKLFRPPYGVLNPNLCRAIKAGNYIPVGWSVRSMDTVIKNEKKLFKKIRSLKPGAIYLFHDTSHTTIRILQEFIQHVKVSGYEIVRLDKMLHLKPYA